jgi:hypothetical protein
MLCPLRLVQCAECFVQSEEDHVWCSARYDARYNHRPVWSVHPSNNYYSWRSGVVEQALPIGQSDVVPKKKFVKKKTHGLGYARGLTTRELAERELKKTEHTAVVQQ